MDKSEPVGKPPPDGDALADLAARLTRLRLRMAAEGRTSAVDALDKAIARETGRRRPAAGE